MPLSGKCLCGSIQYEVDQIEPFMGHCHCSMCRKFHGSAFATYGEAKFEHFRWVEGKEFLASYKAINGSVRRFCKTCGSSMTFTPSGDSGEVIEFSLGTLEGDLDLRPDAHIFVGSKASWFDITDNLPQYETDRRSTLTQPEPRTNQQRGSDD